MKPFGSLAPLRFSCNRTGRIATGSFGHYSFRDRASINRTDTITGGAGDDVLTGGAGTNTFVFLANGGNDTITDYTTGTNSKLDVFGTGLAISAVARAGSAFATFSDSATAADGAVVKLARSTAVASATAATGLFATSPTTGKMGLAASDYALLYVGDDSGTDFAGQLFTIFNNAGTIEAVQIATMSGVNATTLVFANII